MRRPPPFSFWSSLSAFSNGAASKIPRPPIIRIQDTSFYRQHPSSVLPPGPEVLTNPPLFPGLLFDLPSFSSEPQHWSVLGPSSSGKTTFLEILRGQHFCNPPNGRSFPYLSTAAIESKDPRLRNPGRAIQYVGFSGEGGGLGGSGTRGAYLSARYESRREDTDFSLLDYLKGNTELNPSEKSIEDTGDKALLKRVMSELKLENLAEMPVGNLSNGQTRRAKIAKALLGKPEVLLLDEPFMGLDPPTLTTLSPLLHRLAASNDPRLVLSLRPQDPIPDWITHLIYLGPDFKIAHQGTKGEVLQDLRRGTLVTARFGAQSAVVHPPVQSIREIGRSLTSNGIIDPELADIDFHIRSGMRTRNATREMLIDRRRDNWAKILYKKGSRHWKVLLALQGKSFRERKTSKEGDPLDDEGDGRRVTKIIKERGEALVEMEGVKVKYGDKAVLGGWEQQIHGASREGLWWSVARGERWGVFGPNGSGKTTLLSLICSDHPQTYALPIRLFGRSRLPQPGQPGISIFDIQARIGHSSPEVHAFFPRNLTIRQSLENAWADTFLGKPQLSHERDRDVDSCLRWFQPELNPASRQDADQSSKDMQGKDRETANKDEGQSQHPVTVATRIHKLNERRVREVEFQDMLGTDLDWADLLLFGDMPFSAQRVALLLRAIIKKPDIVILDEAFSGMDDYLRDKCKMFLAHGESRTFSHVNKRDPHSTDGRKVVESMLSKKGRVRITGLGEEQALICVSHVQEEVSGLVREWVCLPEANEGKPARFGRLNGPLEGDYSRWYDIWGMKTPDLAATLDEAPKSTLEADQGR
ncbi:MAG: hypothetical protein M1827_002479 [Pycnora praestabilis]|nr:MAG: hypothetical protein M1827_002479 [Pycnora praestabilis]